MKLKSRRVVVVAVGVILAATAAAVIALNFNQPASGGPLSGSPDYGYSVVADVDEDITDAFVVLPIGEDVTSSIELVSVEQVYPNQGLESVGTWLSGNDRARDSQIPEQFYREAPPADPRLGTLREVGGTEVGRDADGFRPQLLLATRVKEEGHHLRDGLWVTYRYEGRTYRDLIPSKLTICTPDFLDESGECPFLGDDDEE